MRAKSGAKKIDMVVFPFSALLLWGDVQKAWAKAHSLFKNLPKDLPSQIPEGSNITGRTWFLDSGSVFVWVQNLDRAEVLAHEAVHCAHHFCTSAGIQDDETEAYMVGHIMREALK